MIEFDEFTLDLSARTLHRAKQPVHLTPKLFDLLALLVERHGQTVDKDEIMRTVWTGVVVEEGGLARNVSLLRKALGEEDGSRFIVTVPKRGYRFVAAIRKAGEAVPLQRPRSIPHPALYAGLVIALIAGVLLLYMRRAADVAPRFSALTTNAAEQAIVAAAISPDGSFLAYYDSSNLYLRPSASQDARRIEIPAGTTPNQIEWFPDKARLLVSAFDEVAGQSSVWSVSIIGGAPVLLHRDASYATVSADGRRIAFVSKGNQIWLANADGSSPQVFAALPANERVVARLQFSADATYLLNGRNLLKQAHSLIEVRRLRDGAVTRLIELSSYPVDFQLLDDGQMLVSCVGIDGSRDSTLDSYPIDLAARTSGAATLLARYPNTWVYGISATRDGRVITFIRDPSQSDVYVADLLPGSSGLTNSHRLTRDDADDRPTAWLPDSGSIVIQSDRGGKWAIYLQASGEDHADLLVRTDSLAAWGEISPDRKWLLYMSGKELREGPDFHLDLMRQPLGGGPPETVSASQQPYRRVQCPRSGIRCVLAEKRGEQRVYSVLDPEAGIGAELLRTPWALFGSLSYDWDVSPDGSRIAVVDPAGLRDRLDVYSIDGKESHTSIAVRGYQSIQSLNWDASGSGFYISITDGMVGGLLHVAMDGSATFLRRQVNGEGWAIPSPDGRRLAIQEWTIAGNVWAIRR